MVSQAYQQYTLKVPQTTSYNNGTTTPISYEPVVKRYREINGVRVEVDANGKPIEADLNKNSTSDREVGGQKPTQKQVTFESSVYSEIDAPELAYRRQTVPKLGQKSSNYLSVSKSNPFEAIERSTYSGLEPV